MRYEHVPNILPKNEVSGKQVTEDPWGEYMKRFAKHLKDNCDKKKMQEAAVGRGAGIGKAKGKMPLAKPKRNKLTHPKIKIPKI